MASVSIYARTLDKVISVAQTISAIGANRAYQGYKRFKDQENFEQMISQLTPYTQGYFVADIGRASRKFLNVSNFSIRGALYMYCPKDLSNNLDASWDIADSLAAALNDPDNFIDADNSLGLPDTVNFSIYEIDAVNTPGILCFDYGKHGAGDISFTTGNP